MTTTEDKTVVTADAAGPDDVPLSEVINDCVTGVLLPSIERLVENKVVLEGAATTVVKTEVEADEDGVLKTADSDETLDATEKAKLLEAAAVGTLLVVPDALGVRVEVTTETPASEVVGTRDAVDVGPSELSSVEELTATGLTPLEVMEAPASELPDVEAGTGTTVTT